MLDARSPALGVGLETQLQLIATNGRVEDRGAYVVATTPGDPASCHGNLLVLPAAPRPGELAWALALFAREIGRPPEVRHVTLYWRAADGEDHHELRDAGFELARTDAMVTAAPPPPVTPAGIAVRPLAADELARTAELAVAADGDEAQRPFRHRRAAWQRELVARGAARFWGAFADQTLVGSLGIVRLGARARYQDVQTAPAYRRRGIAAALLAAAGGEALAGGARELVILVVADDAARVYARAGFVRADRLVAATRVRPVSEPRATR